MSVTKTLRKALRSEVCGLLGGGPGEGRNLARVGTWRGQASPLHVFSGMRVVEDVGGENLVCDLFVVVDRFIGLIVQLENVALCRIFV